MNTFRLEIYTIKQFLYTKGAHIREIILWGIVRIKNTVFQNRIHPLSLSGESFSVCSLEKWIVTRHKHAAASLYTRYNYVGGCKCYQYTSLLSVYTMPLILSHYLTLSFTKLRYSVLNPDRVQHSQPCFFLHYVRVGHHVLLKLLWKGADSTLRAFF